jgi:hypothetical protein
MLSSLTLLDNTQSAAPPLPSGVASDGSGVRFLLRVVGLGLQRIRLDAVSRIYSSMRDSKPLPLLGEVTLDSAMACHDTFAHFLPNSLALCCLAKEAVAPCVRTPDLPDAHTGSAPFFAPAGGGTIGSEVINDAWTLGAEVVGLLRCLMDANPQWHGVISTTLASALGGLVGVLFKSGGEGPAASLDRATDERRLKYAEGLAALQVLGGQHDLVRMGVRASIRDTDLVGVVLGFDDVACMAHLTLASQTPGDGAWLAARVCKRYAQEAILQVQLPGRSLRVNADDLVVMGGLQTAKGLWAEEKGDAGMRASATSVASICEKLLARDALTAGSSGSEGDRPSTEPLQKLEALGPEPEVPSTPAMGTEGEEAPAALPGVSKEPAPQSDGGSVGDVLVAQARSLCVKVVCGMASNRALVHEMVTRKRAFLQQLLVLAIQPDSSASFITLEEAELRTVLMRRRIAQLIAPDIEGGPLLPRKPAEKEEEASGQPLQHLGTSLLNCPACLVRLPGGLRYNRVGLLKEEVSRRGEVETYETDDQLDMGEAVSHLGISKI